MGSQTLIDRAIVALKRLAEESPVGPVAYAMIEELESRRRATPYTVGVAGELADRTILLDRLTGGVLAPIARAPGCPVLRIARSPVDRFRAHHADGTVEDQVRPRRAPAIDNELALTLRPRVEVARTTRDERARAVGDAERALPAVLRTPPARWAFWAWFLRWLLGWLRRDQLAARERATLALAEAEHDLVRAEREVAQAEASSQATHRRYPDRLRELCASATLGVRQIELEIAAGPLPDDVVIHELADGDPGAVDEVIELEGDAVHVQGAGGGVLRVLGPVAEAAPLLPALAVNGRARRLAARAITTMNSALGSLDEMLEGVEVDHRARAARLEALRVTDRATVELDLLARIRPQVHASVNAVMEHAQAHLGGGLAQLGAGWAAAVSAATTKDELAAALAQIDETSPSAVTTLVDEVRLLVMGGVGGSAHDLHPVLLAPLVEYGVSDERLRAPRAAPVLPPVELLARLDAVGGTKLGPVGGWLSKLFRSLDTRRQAAVEKLTERETHLREIAMADLLHAEPRLAAALTAALATVLTAALDQQAAWLAEELADEQFALGRDRESLAPLSRLRELVREDLREVTALVDALDP